MIIPKSLTLQGNSLSLYIVHYKGFTSDNDVYVQSIQLAMADSDVLRKLIAKWTADSDDYRAEAFRLEAADRNRHATSIVMLEARASALDKCVVDAETLARL